MSVVQHELGGGLPHLWADARPHCRTSPADAAFLIEIKEFDRPRVIASRTTQRATMYKHILIATDGSELAHKAVVHGIALAKVHKAPVSIVTVTDVWSGFA